MKKSSIYHIWQVLTIISMFCLCFALLIGCGGSELDLDDLKVREQILAEAFDKDNLQTRGGLYYAPNQEAPFTGWVKETEDDVPYALRQVQDGKRHGISLKWYDNQQNWEKGFYKNGAKDGLLTSWYESGQKSSEGSYKDGHRIGISTYWDENSQVIRQEDHG